ncbi:MAG: oligosaccharide flippase family protein [Gammaproteobacteria bacterium]|nr:MAG: oligosaccharide flippase family protein [Gammaproteobacteria bacterium]
MSDKGKAVKNLIFSSSGMYVETFFAMIMSIIIARTLGPETYGVYALLIWISALGIKITNGGVTTAIVKFISECRVKSPEYISSTIDYLRKIQLIKLCLVFVLFFLVFYVAQGVYLKDISLTLFALLMLAIALRSTYMFYVSYSKGFENFKAIAVISSIGSFIYLLIIVLTAVFFSSLTAFVFVYVLSGLIYLIISKYFTLKWCKHHGQQKLISNKLSKRIKNHVSIVLLNTLLIFLITKESELLFLKYYAEPDDLGYFKVAYMIGFAIALLLPGLFDAILLPLMSGSIAKSKQVAASRFISSIKYILLLAVPASIYFSASAKDIILLLYGESYQPAVVPFQMIVFACCIYSIGSVATSYLLSVDKQTIILRITILGTIVKLVLDYYLIKNYSLVGASIAFSLSLFFMFIVTMIVAIKSLKVRLPIIHIIKVIMATIFSFFIMNLIPTQSFEILNLFFTATLFLFSYIIFSLMLRCWGKEEINYIRQSMNTTKYVF